MTTKIKAGVIGDNVVGITQLNVSDGTNGQVLTTDGSGTLSFSTISSYTDSDVETYLNTSEIYTDATNNRLSIGTASPSAGLLTLSGVDGGSTAGIYFNNTTASTGKSYRLNSGNTGEFMLYDITSSAYRIFVDTSGNVGIGDTSPSVKLDVYQSTVGTGTVDFRHVNGNRILINPSYNYYDAYNHIFRGLNGTDTHMTIDNSGNVGIGTTNPSGEFHVDSGLAPCDIHFTTGSTGGTGYDVNLNLTGGANNSEMNLNMGIAGNADREQIKTYQSTMRFITADTERMRITSNGVILGGVHAGSTSPPNYPGAFTSYRTGSGASSIQTTWGFHASSNGNNLDYAMKVSGTGDYAYGVLNYNENTWMSRLGFDGRIYLTNTTIGSISDRRLKENIVDANSQWDDIKALQFKNYTWKNTERGTGTYLGLIADEVKAISPNLVEVEYATKETLPADGIDPEYEGIKYSIVWMKAVKALQEAMTKIETLETELDAAKARITTLEG